MNWNVRSPVTILPRDQRGPGQQQNVVIHNHVHYVPRDQYLTGGYPGQSGYGNTFGNGFGNTGVPFDPAGGPFGPEPFGPMPGGPGGAFGTLMMLMQYLQLMMQLLEQFQQEDAALAGDELLPQPGDQNPLPGEGDIDTLPGPVQTLPGTQDPIEALPGEDGPVCECPPPPICEEGPVENQMWDVFFDHGDSQDPTRKSPIVLDLNGNERPDITGENILGDGVISGEPINFDLDPTRHSWEFQSIMRRPGQGAPEIDGGFAKVYDANNRLIAEAMPIEEALEITGGRAEFFDRSGALVGELKEAQVDDTDRSEMMYHWGELDRTEQTEWMTPDGGDGLLVWDVDGDQKITSGKELFGNFDVDGSETFKNGYEKLGAYFDANNDGELDQEELAVAAEQGVQVWVDQNGDGVTDEGELQSLASLDIERMSLRFDPGDMGAIFETNH